MPILKVLKICKPVRDSPADKSIDKVQAGAPILAGVGAAFVHIHTARWAGVALWTGAVKGVD